MLLEDVVGLEYWTKWHSMTVFNQRSFSHYNKHVALSWLMSLYQCKSIIKQVLLTCTVYPSCDLLYPGLESYRAIVSCPALMQTFKAAAQDRLAVSCWGSRCRAAVMLAPWCLTPGSTHITPPDSPSHVTCHLVMLHATCIIASCNMG